MAALDMIAACLEYHQAATRRVWTSIEKIGPEQFLQEQAYSRGSIRNLMVHLAHTDLSWLTMLRNEPDIRKSLKKFEEYPDRAAVRSYWESVALELHEYAQGLHEADLLEVPQGLPAPRWAVLLHLVNHGTDHRATVLQKLQAFGAPTFDQDLIFWQMGRW